MDRRIAAQGRARSLRGQRGSPVRKSHVPRLIHIRWQMDGSSCLLRAEQAVARPWVRWMSCPRCVPLDWIAIPSQVVTQQLRTRPYRRGLMRCQQVGPAGSSCREARQHLPDRWPSTGAIPVFHVPDTARASCKNLMLTCVWQNSRIGPVTIARGLVLSLNF